MMVLSLVSIEKFSHNYSKISSFLSDSNNQYHGLQARRFCVLPARLSSSISISVCGVWQIYHWHVRSIYIFCFFLVYDIILLIYVFCCCWLCLNMLHVFGISFMSSYPWFPYRFHHVFSCLFQSGHCQWRVLSRGLLCVRVRVQLDGLECFKVRRQTDRTSRCQRTGSNFEKKNFIFYFI
jgi:hypothetical protein